MVSRNNWKVLGAGVLMGTLGVWSSLAGCQSDSNPGATSSGTGGGGAGDVTSAGGGSTTGSATGGGSTTTTTSTTTTGSGGGAPSCAGQDATMEETAEVLALLDRLRKGDQLALGELFSRYRERLARMIQFRLDGRLKGRIATSDVLQEA